MFKYLLIKLAEEAGEVVVAAIKHRLHRTLQTKANLEGEIGDLLAIVEIVCERQRMSMEAIMVAKRLRIRKERDRMNSR